MRRSGHEQKSQLERTASREIKHTFEESALLTREIIVPLKSVNKHGIKRSKLDAAELSNAQKKAAQDKMRREAAQLARSRKSGQPSHPQTPRSKSRQNSASRLESSGPGLPLKTQVVDSFSKMKRDSKQGFYSYKKEDAYHHFSPASRKSRSRSQRSAKKTTFNTGTKNNSGSKGRLTPKRGGTPRGASRPILKASSRSGSNENFIKIQRMGSSASSGRKQSPATPSAKTKPVRKVPSNNALTYSAPRIKTDDFFSRDLTFTPIINKKSKELDAKRQAGNLNRIEVLHMRGQEYGMNRERRLMEKQLRPTEDDYECVFQPQLNKKYQSKISTDMNVHDRASAWKKRRDQKLEGQREQQRKTKEIEGLLPLKSNQGRRDVHFKSRGLTEEVHSPHRDMTEEEYTEIRINSMRKSLEKQISNFGAGSQIVASDLH